MKKLLVLLLMLALIVASAVSCNCAGGIGGADKGNSDSGGDNGEKDPTAPDVDNSAPDPETVDKDAWLKT